MVKKQANKSLQLMRMSGIMPRSSECFSFAGAVCQLLMLLKFSAITVATATTATTIPKEYNNSNDTASLALLRNIGRSFAQCLSTGERWKCLDEQLTRAIDILAQDNNTWHYGDFIIIEKVASNSSVGNGEQSMFPKLRSHRERSFQIHHSKPAKDSLAASLLHLVKSRSIRLQLPSSTQALNKIGAGISNAIDNLSLGSDEPTVVWTAAEATQVDEGRKKKDKDKNMAIMGGMAMMAMVAQMFLGKVILIAGAAFVMAKLALLVSVLGSLKKGTTGSHGSTEHIVVTSSGHGGGGGHEHEHIDHSYDTGWHRSMPLIYPETQIISEKTKHKGKYNQQIKQHATQHNEGYYNSEISEAANLDTDEGYRRRLAQTGFL